LLRHRWAGSIGDVAHRIRILPRLGSGDYLALVSLADVVLDTLHYGGGANTTYDAFAVGTPVVTLPTRYARGRYAAAAYQQMGLADAVAHSPEAYVEMALRLSNDPLARAERCAQIAQASPALFEDQRIVEELAAFFTQAITAHRA
jgi:protein O-GlcNAc transferase